MCVSMEYFYGEGGQTDTQCTFSETSACLVGLCSCMQIARQAHRLCTCTTDAHDMWCRMAVGDSFHKCLLKWRLLSRYWVVHVQMKMALMWYWMCRNILCKVIESGLTCPFQLPCTFYKQLRMDIWFIIAPLWSTTDHYYHWPVFQTSLRKVRWPLQWEKPQLWIGFVLF